MTSTQPPPPPPDPDRERGWAVEGLRQALARATADELTRLASQLEPLTDARGNVASWLLVLIVDEMLRRDQLPPNAGPGTPAASEHGDGSE